MELVYAKVISGFLLFAVTSLFGLLPYVLFRYVKSCTTILTDSRLNKMQSLAGGIYLGTSFLYLLPESKQVMSKGVSSDLPISEMTVALGVLLLLGIEHVITAYKVPSSGVDAGANRTQRVKDKAHWKKSKKRSSGSGHKRNSALRFVDDNSGAKIFTYSADNSLTYIKYGTIDDSIAVDQRQQQNRFGQTTADEEQSDESDGDNSEIDCASTTETNHLLDANDDKDVLLSDHSQEPVIKTYAKGNEKGTQNQTLVETNKKIPDVAAPTRTSTFRSMVVLLALSVHTVFDGLVIGLQDSQSKLWTLLAAIAVHKALVAVSISLNFLATHRDRPRAILVFILLFALVAPSGLLVGAILTESNIDDHAQNVSSGVLQGISTGSFLYVTFLESLRGRFDQGDRLLNVLFVYVGFVCVLIFRVSLGE